MVNLHDSTPLTTESKGEHPLHGKPVFPLRPGAKTPLTKNGFKDATTDITTLTQWRKQYPGCNWGMPTGHVSGVVVLDVDYKHGVDGFPWWHDMIDEHGAPSTLEVITPNDGLQLFFLAPDGIALANSGSVITDGVDTRGEGGYAAIAPSRVVPESAIPEGMKGADLASHIAKEYAKGNLIAYQFIDASVPIAPVPEWLLAIWPRVGAPQPRNITNTPTTTRGAPGLKVTELIQRYYPRAIRETANPRARWTCRCPLCPTQVASETDAFTVADDNNLWNCFACGKSGNAITLRKDFGVATFPPKRGRAASNWSVEL